MKEDKSFSALWDAQSSSTRIATSIAFAAAAGFLLYAYAISLVPLHAWLYRVFETRGNGFDTLASAAMCVIIATQIALAMRCAKVTQQLKTAQSLPDNFNYPGTGILLMGILALTMLGFCFSLLLMDLPKFPTVMTFTPLFLLTLLNFVVVIVLMMAAAQLVDDSGMPDDPIGMFGVLTSLLGLAFLIPGFSMQSLTLWGSAVVLTFLLRPVSTQVEVAFNQRQRELRLLKLESAETPDTTGSTDEGYIGGML